MAYTRALLFSLLHILSMCSASPLPAESENVIQIVIQQASQLVVRLKEFTYPDGLPTGAPAHDMSGISSIVTALEDYDRRISDGLEEVGQVKIDASSLTGSLRLLRQMQRCGEGPEPLQRLQDQNFPLTATLENLKRMMVYLKQLLINRDRLDIC